MRRPSIPIPPLACALVLFLGCFGPVLFQGRQFGFRDAGSFYYPLYERIQQEWNAGRLPFWEPEENGGQPLLASPTSAVLYPGKLVFFALPYPWAFRVYILAHYVLACATMYSWTRSWGASTTAATIAALSYGFGGPVLFQHCNVVYLVGSAWMPLLFEGADRWLRRGDRRGPIAIGVAGAMQVLGGDAQAAAMGLSCVTIQAIAAALARRGHDAAGSRAAPLGGVLGGLVLAALLAGAQVVPTIEFHRNSTRSEAAARLDVDSFSLEPLRLAELAWPRVFGDALSNRHWVGLVPPRHEVEAWVPSLYTGAATLLLALGAVGVRRGPGPRRLLTAILVVSLGLAFGKFAGPFAVVEHLVTGFGAFRYPSKFLALTALVLSGLAALGWDDLVGRSGRRIVAVAVVVAACGATALVLSFALATALEALWRAAPPDLLAGPFGRFDAAGALAETRASLVQGCVAAIAAGGIALAARRGRRGAAVLMLTLLTIDLLLAGVRLVPTVPGSMLDRANPPELLSRILEAERAAGSKGRFRIHRMPNWQPPYWRGDGRAMTVEDITGWERATLDPKHGIAEGVSFTYAEGSAEVAGRIRFFAPFLVPHIPMLAPMLGIPAGEPMAYFPRRGYDLWSTRYFVLPFTYANDVSRGFASLLPETEVVHPPPSSFAGPDGAERRDRWAHDHDWQLLRNRAAFPRAWVVHRVRLVDERELARPGGEAAVLAEILYEGDAFWSVPRRRVLDPRDVAWVTAAPGDRLEPRPSGMPPDDTEAAAVVVDEPGRVEIEAQLASAGVLVVADTHYPGWRLQVDGRAAPILRANLMMRGVALGPGRHRLVFTYAPDSVRIGLATSLAGLVALAVACVWAARSRRSPVPAAVTSPAPEAL